MRQALGRSAALLGFSLGGFFDGILLHQILQWHHLLSDVHADGLQDLRLQVLADGIFHLVMYLIAVVALVGLWRARRAIGNAVQRPWWRALHSSASGLSTSWTPCSPTG